MRIFGMTVGWVFCVFVLSATLSAQELRFRGPFGIPDVPRPVTVHAGDIDGNGKLDLIASSGTNTVRIYFQETDSRTHWTTVVLPVGRSTFFTRAGDFDNDGFDDLAVADGGSTTYYVRSRGDRTFDPPVSLRQSRGSRWIALGDWDRDGNLDLASSNLNSGTLTIFVGDGQGNFTLTGSPPSTREHTLETLDYDGDGILDLALGTGIPGIQLHKGVGDGTFVRRGTVPGHNSLLGCVEYISVGDFNNDGLDDLAPTCIDDGVAYAGTSRGNGTYQRILRDPFAAGTESSAIGDFNGDGNDDLALVSQGSTLVRVHVGRGDGTFEDPRHFGSTGSRPVFLIAEDLDRDGHVDIISADEISQSLTIFFGQSGEHFLQSSQSVSGYGSARGYAVTDWDKDGVPDFFYASASRAEINVYLKPGLSTASSPDFLIKVAERYSVLALGDLNGDGIVDLVGGNTRDDALLTALLDAQGSIVEEQSLPCGANPKYIMTTLLDAGPTVDVVALCTSGSTDDFVILHGQGNGKFEEALILPTIDNPRVFDVGDIDEDGRMDLAVVSTREIAIHLALVGGGYSEPILFDPDNGNFKDVELVDLDADGHLDILTADTRAHAVAFYRGAGGREFERVTLDLDVRPAVIEAVDVDQDGRLDIAAGDPTSQTVAFLFNRGEEGFSDPQLERAGAPMAMLRIMDVNQDGVNDIVAFGSATTGVVLGEIVDAPAAPRFKRGDADGDGRVGITDVVVILGHLFQGQSAISCLDAADPNDDGTINLSDPVGLLNYLFQGGGTPPAPPGPTACGVDPTEDALGECVRDC